MATRDDRVKSLWTEEELDAMDRDMAPLLERLGEDDDPPIDMDDDAEEIDDPTPIRSYVPGT